MGLRRAKIRLVLVLSLACATFYVTEAPALTCGQAAGDPLAWNNPTAARSRAEYTQPDSRGLTEYNAITGVRRFLHRRSLLSFVPEGGLVIDVGGQGRAIHEMAQRAPIHSVVINTQEQANQSFLSQPLKGTFSYLRGWAQRLLPQFRGQADLVLDIWGAFSYEMDKAQILNLIYGSLKPGGRALILFHPSKTPARVKVLGRRVPVPLHRWLIETYPEIASRHPVYVDSVADILMLQKPADGSGPEAFPLRLKKGRLLKSSHRDAHGRPKQIVPESELEIVVEGNPLPTGLGL
ncbi:MAG TPA: class I SAM-dependent methyltransferase [Bdellovibrionales bacterium]|nr:class I SAM-dependent methyltransferase [Bdellovibrionales bacterium]